MIKKEKRTNVIFLGIILISISINVSAIGIGVSPGSVSFSNVLRSGYAEKTIMLSTSSEDPIECRITAEGPFKDWLSYGSGETFTLPPRSHLRLKISVQPPEDIPNGVYEGYITVAVSAKGDSGRGMGSVISTAVSLRASIEISDLEIRHYKVFEETVSVKDTEERRPMEFSMDVENDGNVRLYPKIHIDILSEDKSNVLKSVDYSEKLLLPTTRESILITVQNDLPIGKYWGRVTAYVEDDVLMEKLLTFEVLERGSLRIQGKLLRVGLNKIWVGTGEIVEIKAYFRNTGVLATPAIFKGKVTLGDTVVDTIESDEIEVPVGQETELTTYYEPKENGRHIISGRVHFSKKLTHSKSSILNVRESRVEETTTTSIPETVSDGIDPASIITIFIILTFIAVGVVFWKRKIRPVNEEKRGDKLGGL
ncbi:MAG: hypothetical protein U9Q22_08685 [Candidatus Altiarchaeota archaeon]|nr:hypothetical protein [Candidatus Altiarchaeota archaeon]